MANVIIVLLIVAYCAWSSIHISLERKMDISVVVFVQGVVNVHLL